MKRHSSDVAEKLAIVQPRRSCCSMYRASVIYALVASLVIIAIANRDKLCATTTTVKAVVAPPPLEAPKAPRVFWKRLALSQINLLPSTYECDNADPLHQTCIFRNLVLYQARLFYVLPDSQTKSSLVLPNPVLFDTDTATMSLVDYAIPEILHVLSRSEMTAHIAATAGAIDVIKVARHKIAIFQRIRSFTNWYWMLNSVSNTYHRLCKYMNVCSAEDMSRVAWLQPAARTESSTRHVGHIHLLGYSHSKAANDLRKCLGPLFWVDHPAHDDTIDIWVGNEILIMNSVLFGVGEDTVQPNVALKIEDQEVYAPTNNTMALHRVQFLRNCAGLPPLPTPRARPNVVLINRPFGDGRSIIGLDDVYDRLKHTLPPDIPLSLYYPRGGMVLHEQASAFDDASVLVIPHGAATANFVYLPLDAVVLDVFAMSAKHEHDTGIVNSLPSPPYNITIVPVNCSNLTEPYATGTKKLAAWNNLTPEQQADLLSHSTIDDDLNFKVKTLLNMNLLDWMDFRAYHPDAEMLTQAVLDAVALWEEKTAARREWERRGGYKLYGGDQAGDSVDDPSGAVAENFVATTTPEQK